jgi:hypothetical protein
MCLNKGRNFLFFREKGGWSLSWGVQLSTQRQPVFDEELLTPDDNKAKERAYNMTCISSHIGSRDQLFTKIILHPLFHPFLRGSSMARRAWAWRFFRKVYDGIRGRRTTTKKCVVILAPLSFALFPFDHQSLPLSRPFGTPRAHWTFNIIFQPITYVCPRGSKQRLTNPFCRTQCTTRRGSDFCRPLPSVFVPAAWG